MALFHKNSTIDGRVTRVVPRKRTSPPKADAENRRDPSGRPRPSNTKLAYMIFTCLVLFPFASTAHGVSAVGEVREADKLYKNDRFDEALKKYDEAIAVKPDDPVIQYNRGAALYRTGNFTGAFDDFLASFGSENKDVEGKAIYNAGNSKFRLGQTKEKNDPAGALSDYNEAAEHYKKAIELAPSDIDSKYNYEFTLKKIKDIEEMMKKNQKKMQMDQKDQKNKDQQKQQQNQKDQQKQDQKDKQQQNQDQKDQQNKDQQQQDQQKQDQQDKDKQQQDQQQKDQQKQDQKDQQDKEKQKQDQQQKEKEEQKKQEEKQKQEQQKQQQQQKDQEKKDQQKQQDQKDQQQQDQQRKDQKDQQDKEKQQQDQQQKEKEEQQKQQQQKEKEEQEKSEQQKQQEQKEKEEQKKQEEQQKQEQQREQQKKEEQKKKEQEEEQKRQEERQQKERQQQAGQGEKAPQENEFPNGEETGTMEQPYGEMTEGEALMLLRGQEEEEGRLRDGMKKIQGGRPRVTKNW